LTLVTFWFLRDFGTVLCTDMSMLFTFFLLSVWQSHTFLVKNWWRAVYWTLRSWGEFVCFLGGGIVKCQTTSLDQCLKYDSVGYTVTYRRDICFDANLFPHLFCLYHVKLCAHSNDVTSCFFCF